MRRLLRGWLKRWAESSLWSRSQWGASNLLDSFRFSVVFFFSFCQSRSVESDCDKIDEGFLPFHHLTKNANERTDKPSLKTSAWAHGEVRWQVLFACITVCSFQCLRIDVSDINHSNAKSKECRRMAASQCPPSPHVLATEPFKDVKHQSVANQPIALLFYRCWALLAGIRMRISGTARPNSETVTSCN